MGEGVAHWTREAASGSHNAVERGAFATDLCHPRIWLLLSSVSPPPSSPSTLVPPVLTICSGTHSIAVSAVSAPTPLMQDIEATSTVATSLELWSLSQRMTTGWSLQLPTGPDVQLNTFRAERQLDESGRVEMG